MYRLIIIILSLLAPLESLPLFAQDLDIEGSARITTMAPASADARPVGVEADGSLVSMNSTTTYAIGDYAHGGVVFWVTPDGRHGRVVSIYDIAGTLWSNITTGIGSTSQSDVNGAGNSVAITLQTGHTHSAAQHCLDLAFSGYDDWYLPSKMELDLIYQNRTTINETAITNGGEAFAETIFWSSTERSDDSSEAWNQSFFGSGNQNTDLKTNNFHVRAIRAF